MGMAMRCPADATPGKIRRRCSAAAAAFGAPPSRQSANLEERLSNRVAERHHARIDEGDVPNPPREETPRHRTPERPRAEQQTPRLCQPVAIELGQKPPTHEFQVQIHRLRRQTLGIHARAEVHRARTRAAARVKLPTHRAGTRRVLAERVRRETRKAKDEFEGRFGGDATGGSSRANDPNRVDAPSMRGERREVSKRPPGVFVRGARIRERERHVIAVGHVQAMELRQGMTRDGG